MLCRGKCELQITKILNDPIQPEVVPDLRPGEAQPGLGDYPKKADSEAAIAALIAAIRNWAKDSATVSCAQPAPPPHWPAGVPYSPCSCTAVDQLTDADWAKKPGLQQEFRHKFTAKNRNWEAKVVIDYKVAFVAGICKEPRGFIYYVSNIGVLEDHGLAVLAMDGREISAETLARLKAALG